MGIPWPRHRILLIPSQMRVIKQHHAQGFLWRLATTKLQRSLSSSKGAWHRKLTDHWKRRSCSCHAFNNASVPTVQVIQCRLRLSNIVAHLSPMKRSRPLLHKIQLGVCQRHKTLTYASSTRAAHTNFLPYASCSYGYSLTRSANTNILLCNGPSRYGSLG